MQRHQPGIRLASLLPPETVRELGFSSADEARIAEARAAMSGLPPAQRRTDALARISARKWKMPDGWKFDRDEANAQ
jgi:antitoxin MazE